VMETVNDMSSDHYASEILMRTIDKDDLSSKQMAILINAAADLSSDHYKTRVLTRIADRIPEGDTRLKDLIRQAAKSIRSDTYYGRVIRSLDN